MKKNKSEAPVNILQRVTTLEDACKELGKNYKTIYGTETDPVEKSEIAIKTFAEALREGKPAKECFYYPVFWRSSAGGFRFSVYVDGDVVTLVGARLRVDSPEKARHLAKCMDTEFNIYLKG